jgi:cytidine deaminase
MREAAENKEIPQPELFIGLVGAVGTELDRLITELTESLKTVSYEATTIRLASLLRDLPKYTDLPTKYVDEYIDSHMDAGDDFRQICERDDAVALLGVARIKEEHLKAGELAPNRAYILRSVKNPEEIKTLRNIYGNSFYLVAAYSPLQDRRTYLAKRIAGTRNEFPFDRHFITADRLIQRDQEEIGTTHGQNTRDSFHRADVFVDMSDHETLTAGIKRFIELLFGNSFHTPTKAEYAMFHAQAAALRSAELGRQVGAAIVTEAGNIVAVGCNEVPRAGGGLYWCDDKPDKREFRQGVDSSNEQKRNLIAETLGFLKKAGWLSQEKAKLDLEQLVELAIGRTDPVLPKDSKIRSLIEFGRAVHAEMAALTDAARRGVSVGGCTMYVTTFPCHLCARNIVAAGIKRVIYIEPYAKSLTAELYPDSIAVDGDQRNKHQVPFDPFVGIAPRQYMNLFTQGRRKSSDGSVLIFSPRHAKLRYYEEPTIYLENELKWFKNLSDKMKARGII